MPARIPEEVKTSVEKYGVPLVGGALAGIAAYSLAKESPTVYGVGFAALTAYLISR